MTTTQKLTNKLYYSIPITKRLFLKQFLCSNPKLRFQQSLGVLAPIKHHMKVLQNVV